MKKFVKFMEKVGMSLASFFFELAIVAASLGLSIWAVKWVLKLLGVI